MEGSKILNCEIVKSEIFAKMKDSSYYIGESMKSDPRAVELAAKIQASDDEDPKLIDIMANAVSVVANIISSMVGETSYEQTDDSLVFTVRAKSNVPDYMESQLSGYITNYMSTYILYGWLELVSPESAKTFNESLSRLEKEIRILGSRRTKPERP